MHKSVLLYNSAVFGPGIERQVGFHPYIDIEVLETESIIWGKRQHAVVLSSMVVHQVFRVAVDQKVGINIQADG